MKFSGPKTQLGQERLGALLNDPAAAKALTLLSGAGEEARIVGGAVRDCLLGEPIADIDVATTCAPDEIMRRAQNAGLRAIPTGIDHGVVTLMIGERAVEASALRADVATDGRRAVVLFSRDFVLDASRRDFTINALSLSANAEVFDPFDGLCDLEAGRIKFIGPARQRIAEDFLRILRFFRFSGDYGDGPIDSEGLSAVIVAREGLKQLSAERVREELLKILGCRRAGEMIALMSEIGLFQILLGAVAYPSRLNRALALDPDCDVLMRLAAVSAQVTEDVENLRFRLRLSNAQTKKLHRALAALEKLREDGAPPRGARLGEYVLTHGAESLADALKLGRLDAPDTQVRFWSDALINARRFEGLRLPASGEDIKRRGVPPGIQIGRTLKILQALWIRAHFPREPEAIARLIDEAVAAAGSPSNTVG